jgi:GMP synthase-like glutamine amidotransferase
MHVHSLQHADFEDLGTIEPWLRRQGHAVAASRLHAGEALPEIGGFDALIVMGGPMNIYQYDRYPWLRAEQRLIRSAIAAGRRLLGICLGAQLIADALGGPVSRNPQPEVGWFPVTMTAAGRRSALFAGLPDPLLPFHWHSDTFALPPGAECLAASSACAQQAFAFGPRILGLQFHPEVTRAALAAWFACEQPAAGPGVQPTAEILARDRAFAELLEWFPLILGRFFAQP